MGNTTYMDLVVPGILIAGAWWVWQTIKGTATAKCPFGVLDPTCLAGEAGAAVGEKVVTPVYQFVTNTYTNTTSSVLDYLNLVDSTKLGEHSYVVVTTDPVTGIQCDPNDYAGGPNACVRFGSSSGQSPEQFCADYPSAPICANVKVPWYMTAPVIGWFI